MRSFRRRQTDYVGKPLSKAEQVSTGLEDESREIPFGVDGSELPGFPLESQPGNVVFFNQRLWHSSFGGKTGRRMFTLNYGEKLINEDHISLLKMVYGASPGDELYTDAFLNSKRPRIQRMMTVRMSWGSSKTAPTYECSSQELIAYFTVSTSPVPYGFWEAESL